ncbi:G2/mitotic-specific cyclin S13-6 [Medicago truncatula]|uniref:G2/mitotic-specific cyclin S13-6 n=1 Tax=Medicago truncatula TaxID=3880 RepID=UPI000D2F2A4C|nr:G2/mitotic-specific cyclin S13-6 [Medicago truncatula]
MTIQEKLEVNDVTSDVSKEKLVAMKYIEELNKFYKKDEGSTSTGDYAVSQSNIYISRRPKLLDRVIGIHTKYAISQESLFLAMNIVDRFLVARSVREEKLRLVGMGAWLIAYKYGGIWHLKVDTFVTLPDNPYTRAQILWIEEETSGALNRKLTVSTPFHFLSLFFKAPPDDTYNNFLLENMTYFLSELGMINFTP